MARVSARNYEVDRINIDPIQIENRDGTLSTYRAIDQIDSYEILGGGGGGFESFVHPEDRARFNADWDRERWPLSLIEDLSRQLEKEVSKESKRVKASREGRTAIRDTTAPRPYDDDR